MTGLQAGQPAGLVASLRELARHWELLVSWVGRELKVRYKQSALGAAWAVLQPLSATLIFVVVFARFARVPTGGVPSPLFYYSALLPWTFLSSSLSFAVPSLVNNLTLVTKTYFPREILPVAEVLASLVDFAIASLLFAILIVVYRAPLTANLVYAPLIVALEVIFVTGVVVAAAAANVFYHDVRFVVPLVAQLWMYATPVIYPLAVVPESWRAVYMLNPMAGLVESYRRVTVMGQPPDPRSLGLAAALSLVTFVLAYRLFKRVEMRFADVI